MRHRAPLILPRTRTRAPPHAHSLPLPRARYELRLHEALAASSQRTDHVLGVCDEYLCGIGSDVAPALSQYQIDELLQLVARGRLIASLGSLFGIVQFREKAFDRIGIIDLVLPSKHVHRRNQAVSRLGA